MGIGQGLHGCGDKDFCFMALLKDIPALECTFKVMR